MNNNYYFMHYKFGQTPFLICMLKQSTRISNHYLFHLTAYSFQQLGTLRDQSDLNNKLPKC